MKSKQFSLKTIALLTLAMLLTSICFAQNSDKQIQQDDKKVGVTITRTTENASGNPVQSANIKVDDKSIATTPSEIKDANSPYYSVSEMPAFIDGKKELQTFVAKNVRYPAEAKLDKAQGIVIVQFIVEKDGVITNPKVIESIHPKLDEEALRLVSTMKFTPGKEKGEPVRCYYQVPVPFFLYIPEGK